MTLTFITGNENKLREARQILGAVQSLKLDLSEIQSLDPHEVIRAKLKEAFKHHPGPFIVEDTSLSLDCLNGLPGTFIKFFLETVKEEGLSRIATHHDNPCAIAKTIIGYATDPSDVHFFEGTIVGKVVAPRGSNGFGWDVIFVPEGHHLTFAEMSSDEKNSMSMRKRAFEQLLTYLAQSKK